MFTGLVECLGEVTDLPPLNPGLRLVIRQPKIAHHLAIGDSVAVNGCCLTVVERHEDTMAFDAGEETLSRTNLARLCEGSRVNLERSLRLSDRLGGHLVTGHIDALGELDARDDRGDWSTMWFRVPARLTRQMASKGSVAVDGVSLTLVNVESERFSVALIPHTLSMTTLGALQIGDAVNIETDLLAKYVERQFEARS